VLIDAASSWSAEGGADAVSVREAARRAGVSPGAPVRHFASRDALMAAVAEEAQRRSAPQIDAALAKAPADDPLARFRGWAFAYVRWAIRNPTHFEIISSRPQLRPRTNRRSCHGTCRSDRPDRAHPGRGPCQGAAFGSSNPRQVLIGGGRWLRFARMSIDGHFALGRLRTESRPYGGSHPRPLHRRASRGASATVEREIYRAERLMGEFIAVHDVSTTFLTTRCEFQAAGGRLLAVASQALGCGRIVSRRNPMAAPPNPGPSVITVAARACRDRLLAVVFAVAMPHLAGLVIMLRKPKPISARAAGFVLGLGHPQLLLHLLFCVGRRCQARWR